MPLFELSPAGVKPFRRLSSSAEIYEREIESLFWENLEAFVGEPLFPVARQARIAGGGIPDLVALDPQGRVVVIEVKRDIDRGQLAQTLEYAGWARATSLDELAGLYRQGAHRFFTDWQEFTNTTTPTLLDRAPRLVLVARSFDARTESALGFLRESGVPLKLIQVVFYQDANGSRIIDVNNGELESPNVMSGPAQTAGAPQPTSPDSKWIDGLVATATAKRRSPSPRSAAVRNDVSLMDLLEAGVLRPDESIVWSRPQARQQHTATISENGEVVLPDGRTFTSLSLAANALAGGSFNGWECWMVPRMNGVKIGALRSRVNR